jgi:PAS domain S-box-containing protein
VFWLITISVSLFLIIDLVKNNFGHLSAYSTGILIIALIFSINYNWKKAIVESEAIANELEVLLDGQPVSTIKIAKSNPLAAQQIAKISSLTSQATIYAENIGKGNSNIQLDENFPLNKSLLEMEKYLQQLQIEEQKRNWVVQGIADLGDVIRENLNSKVDDLANLVLNKLIKYLNANQAGLFLTIETQDEKYIKLISCYAYDKKKYHQKRIEWGEGMIGECIRDQDLLYITDIPEDYINITSGLGTSNPRNIIICPLKTNEGTIGAIEIASFQVMDEFKKELIVKVCESLASTIVTVQNNRKNLDLLDQADHIEQTLREKENILMQNAEELTATQEELNRRLLEIQIEANLNKNILEAINKSNAMIEFDMSGHILDANDLYLNFMGYKKEELIGKTEEMLLPKDGASRQNLTMLWSSLSQGQFNSGQFKRLSKSGEEVWVEASFNPILDINGQPMKVLMFAQFISDILARENELKNKVAVLNEAVPYAEIDETYKVKNSNSLFMNMFGLTRKTNKGFELIHYLSKNAQINYNIQQKISLHETFKDQFKCLLLDGSIAHFNAHFYPLKDLNGKITGTGIILNRNIEPLQDNEVELKVVVS